MDALKPKPHPDSDATTNANDPIAWFRQASPYINTHRGKTFVIYFDGKTLASEHFPTLVHDLTLLRNLGIRLVLVHGLRNQINDSLTQAGILSRFEKGIRITTEDVMDKLLECVGRARIAIESRLSMGLPNTPMSGAHVSVASGNFVTAQPFGVVDGVDYHHTGIVRQIHINAIRRQIENEQLVLLSPLGYSRTGELFNLQAEEVATRTATALGAEKLIFLSDTVIHDEHGEQIRESTLNNIAKRIDDLSLKEADHSVLKRAIEACQQGVKRVHILNQNDPDALLRDLFTRDGSGTLINADNYETTRQAHIKDVGGIIELIAPLEKDGTLVARSREQLELSIGHFLVTERDGTVIACAAMIPDDSLEKLPGKGHHTSAEIACVVTHPDYRGGGRAEAILRQLEANAKTEGINWLYVLTTRTNHWFIEQNYQPATQKQLPPMRLEKLDQHRNSKILIKKLE